MSKRPEFEFVTACRDKRIGNCPELATNVPGVVALRDSERPEEVVTMSAEAWADLVKQQAQEFGLSA